MLRENAPLRVSASRGRLAGGVWDVGEPLAAPGDVPPLCVDVGVVAADAKDAETVPGEMREGADAGCETPPLLTGPPTMRSVGDRMVGCGECEGVRRPCRTAADTGGGGGGGEGGGGATARKSLVMERSMRAQSSSAEVRCRATEARSRSCASTCMIMRRHWRRIQRTASSCCDKTLRTASWKRRCMATTAALLDAAADAREPVDDDDDGEAAMAEGDEVGARTGAV